MAVSSAGVKVLSMGSVSITSCPDPIKGLVSSPAIKDFTNLIGYLSVPRVNECWILSCTCPGRRSFNLSMMPEQLEMIRQGFRKGTPVAGFCNP